MTATPHSLTEAELRAMRENTSALRRTLAAAQQSIEHEKRRLEYRAGYSIRDATALALHHFYVVMANTMLQVADDLRREADRQIDVRAHAGPTYICAACTEPIFGYFGACRADAEPRHTLCALCVAKRYRGVETECVPCALKMPPADTLWCNC